MSKGSSKLAGWLVALVSTLQGEQYYGKIILQFENGRLTVVRKEQTLKPPPV